MSPDGHKVVFVADSAGRPRLWLRLLDCRRAKAIDGDRRCTVVPSGRRIAGRSDSLRMASSSESTSTVDRFTHSRTLRAARAARGAATTSSCLRCLAARSFVSPTVVVSRSLSRSSSASKAVTFLHNSCRTVVTSSIRCEAVRGWVASMSPSSAKRTSRRLLDADPGAVYVASGHLLFVRQGTLFAQDFDPVRLELTGNPVHRGRTGGVRSIRVSVSGAGSIAYRIERRRRSAAVCLVRSVGQGNQHGGRFRQRRICRARRCHPMASVWRSTGAATGNAMCGSSKRDVACSAGSRLTPLMT